MVIYLNIKLILKGFLVGLGKIIPGVSGSMFAITLGIYEQIILAITDFFSNVKKHTYILFNFGLGILLAIILFSKMILFLLANYYNETMSLFLGLILGTLIPFTKNLKPHFSNILIFLLFFTLTLSLSLITTTNTFIFNGSFINYIYTSLLGFIDALTSIIPGISGTAIYMLLGSYEYVLSILGNPFYLPFIIYTFGLIIGIIITSYFISYLFKHFKNSLYWAIFGLMLGSILLLLLNLKLPFDLFYLFIFTIGIILGFLFDKS